MALTQKVIEIHKEAIDRYLSGGKVWWESMLGWEELESGIKIEDIFFADLNYKILLDEDDIYNDPDRGWSRYVAIKTTKL